MDKSSKHNYTKKNLKSKNKTKKNSKNTIHNKTKKNTNL